MTKYERELEDMYSRALDALQLAFDLLKKYKAKCDDYQVQGILNRLGPREDIDEKERKE